MKKIVFLTGTRADFGKIKSLIAALESQAGFEPYVFVTGMHLQEEYGFTMIEIQRANFSNVHAFKNYTHESTMDLTLAKTIEGFSAYTKEIKPDLIVVHGDRVETLSGAIVGALNNILVAHIEGGELSGTVDELIRHSVSKLSHIHFVSNQEAAKRLIQMGELPSSVFSIGSPDIDIMFSATLPDLQTAKDYYQIPFDSYAILVFHPVTTEIKDLKNQVNNLLSALLEEDGNYVVIYPNNDYGSQHIIEAYERIADNERFKIFPSLRFEYFLSLLKNATFIIGNSSTGIREAPYYGIPVINIGSRQMNRTSNSTILNTDYSMESIRTVLKQKQNLKRNKTLVEFGKGNSTQLFLEALNEADFWKISQQKQFEDKINEA